MSYYFETERLICRTFNDSDAEDMLQNWVSDPDIQTEYGEPVYTDITQVSELIRLYTDPESPKSRYRFAIIEKDSGRNIGQIAFCRIWDDYKTAEIEYCIGKQYWGRGYAGEALSGLIAYTFAYTDILKLEAYHRAENAKSGRVLEKSAMHITDTVQRFVHEEISAENEVCYCIEKNEYLRNCLRNLTL